MSKIINTLRRAVIASIIAGSLAQTAMAGNFSKVASQLNQKFNNARTTVGNKVNAAKSGNVSPSSVFKSTGKALSKTSKASAERFKEVSKLKVKPAPAPFKEVTKLKVKPSPKPFKEVTKLKVKPTPGPVVNDNQGHHGNAGVILGHVLSNIQAHKQHHHHHGVVVHSNPVVPVQYIETAPPIVEVAQAIDTEVATSDLVLVDIKLAQEATQLAGPAYSLTFTNQGLAGTPKFVAAAIISNDGTASIESPKAAVEVPGLAAGETRTITLRLPRGESKFLVLALDLNDNVSESDKDNNMAVIERAE